MSAGAILSDPLAAGVGGAVIVITVQGAWKVVHLLAAALAKRNGRVDPPPSATAPPPAPALELCRAHGERLSSLETTSKAAGETIREIRRDVKSISGDVGKLLVLSEKANGGKDGG